MTMPTPENLEAKKFDLGLNDLCNGGIPEIIRLIKE